MAKPKSKSEKRRIRARREQERVNENILESKEKLLQRVQEERDKLGVDLKVDLNNPVKMSDVILDFAQPLLDVARGFEAEEKAVKLAILAWNLSLLPEAERTEGFEKLRASTRSDDEAGRASLEHVLSLMLARKKALFDGNDRMVLDHDIVRTPNGLHLNVVSSITKAGH